MARRIAITLDGKELTNPVVQQAITKVSKATISGSQSLEEAKDLAILLRSGALPVKINVLGCVQWVLLWGKTQRQIHGNFQCWYCNDHDFLG